MQRELIFDTLAINGIPAFFTHNAEKHYDDKVVYLENANTIRIMKFDDLGYIVASEYKQAPRSVMDLVDLYNKSVDEIGIGCVAWL